MSIESLARRVAADASDAKAVFDLLRHRARIEGPSVYLECLADVDAWKAAPLALKIRAGLEIHQRLDGFGMHEELRVWECDNLNEHLEPETISHQLATFTHKATGIEFQLLPGKKGEVVEELEGVKLDIPGWEASNVTLSEKAIKPFLIARWPVTKDQCAKMKYHVFTTGPEPRVDIPFNMAALHCKQRGMRLPTAQEWTYACKAGTSTRFYWGDEMDDSHCWHAGNSPLSPVAGIGCREPRSHPPKTHDDAGKYNAFGLVDCYGGVFEWLSGGSIQGGSYASSEQLIESASYRHQAFDIENDFDQIGFRPAVSIPGKD